MRSTFQPMLVNGPFADPALFGPANFIEHVHHRLASYTWNLVENYSVDLAITAREVPADGSRTSRATFNSRERFLRRDGDAGDLQRINGLAAGAIARDAGARDMVPFHFSPRYANCEGAPVSEARAAFRGSSE